MVGILEQAAQVSHLRKGLGVAAAHGFLSLSSLEGFLVDVTSDYQHTPPQFLFTYTPYLVTYI